LLLLEKNLAQKQHKLLTRLFSLFLAYFCQNSLNLKLISSPLLRKQIETSQTEIVPNFADLLTNPKRSDPTKLGFIQPGICCHPQA